MDNNFSPTITKEEYLKLIQEIIRQEDEDLYDDVDCDAWIPSEPPVKKKAPLRHGTLNALRLKRDYIRKVLSNYQQIEIGNFLVVLTDVKDKNYNICVYETKFKTPTGRACKMQYKIDLFSDTRFKNGEWTNYFKKNTGTVTSQWGFYPISSIIGMNIPEETLLDIIRHIQVVAKLPAFI